LSSSSRELCAADRWTQTRAYFANFKSAQALRDGLAAGAIRASPLNL
jgi:hypothetical protein